MHETDVNKLRVVFYCRVSTEEQREGQTIDSQLAELEKFVSDKNWSTIDIYKDNGWSGAILARPELDRLRDDASRGRFDAVLINDVDRLARDVSHLGVIRRDLERHRIRIIFRKLPGEQSPTQNLLVNILGSFAEFEKELIADRTRRGKRHKVEVRKQFLGSIPPYGFRYITKSRSDSGEGRLEILPQEAAHVRAMYRWVGEEGLSAHQVVKRLDETKTMPRKGGRHWGKSSVLRILRAEVYAGVWHYNKHQSCEPHRRMKYQKYRRSPHSSGRLRPRGEWLPVPLPEQLRIIEPVLWRRVQKQLDRNTTLSRRNAKHMYLLAGLMKCGGCNAAYIGDPGHKRFAYRCSNRCRKYGSISEQYVNAAVWNAITEALQNPALIVQGIKDIHSHRKLESKRDNEEIERSREEIQAEEGRIIQAYRMGMLSPEQLGHELELLKRRQKSTEVSSSQPTRNQERRAMAVRHPLEQYCQRVSERLGTLVEEQKQQILRLLLTRVVFEGDRVRITGVIPVGTHDQHGVVATTASWDDGRNTSTDCGRIADKTSCDSGGDQRDDHVVITDEGFRFGVPDEVEFELITPITRPNYA